MILEPFTFVLERLEQLLIDEIKFLSTDQEKLFGNLKQQVELAQSFVRDVEEEKQQATITHVLETEVQHIMQILPQIEDFLDTLYQEEVQQSQKQISCFPKFMSCFSYSSNPLVHRHLVIDKAIQLADDLQATRQRAEPYKRESNRPQVTKRRRPQTQPNIIDDQYITGLEEDVKTLVGKLVGKHGDNTTTLAIVGMGGAGKTTLARQLYNHDEITRHFTSRAWICVSQQWDTPQLLREICAQVNIHLAECEMSIVGVKIREFLQKSSCFIVLDDVWKKEALQELLPLLRIGSGRMLITTRNEDIVKFHSLGRFHIHKARCLTEEESWNLFSIIVRSAWQGIGCFHDEGEFACLGKEMLRRCHGLPLAVVALAGLLSAKATIQEWESTKNNVISRLMIHDSGSYDYGAVKEMLELSYFDLPYDLKSCFLYLGIFPEDSAQQLDDIIQLWIGEGFLRTNMCNEGQTLEELARNFLDQLVQRCMVQVKRRDYEGKVELIQVHDLIRDLCIEKARELKLFEIASPSTLHSTSIIEPMFPRIIIHYGDSHSIPNPRLRSVIRVCKILCTIKLNLTYEKMKLLRVLHLYWVHLGELGEQIENLILLRYLRIVECDGATNILFEHMKKLRNLLTLIYIERGTETTIPNNMVGSMDHIRHLHLGLSKIEGPLLGVTRSRSLQYLWSQAGEWLTKELCVDSLINSLQELTLRKIQSQAQLEVIYEFVRNPSNHLHVLELQLEKGSRLEFDLERMELKCRRLLKVLHLLGQIRKQSRPSFFPPNLLDLWLFESKIEKEEDLERAITQLHQLRRLYLFQDSYEGDKLTMTGLPQLQFLDLCGLPNLKEWRIEEGALSQLKDLHLSSCKQLERIPEEISGIHTLQRFSVGCMSESFCKRLRPPLEGNAEGEHFHLIRHIPELEILDTNGHGHHEAGVPSVDVEIL